MVQSATYRPTFSAIYAVQDRLSSSIPIIIRQSEL
jgi:hypothetical protein